MAFQPTSFQQLIKIIVTQMSGVLELIKCRFLPKILSTTPPSLKMFFAILAMITQDTKCGRYDMVCVTFLNLVKNISFKRTANAIAAIVPTAISRKLTPNVLISVCVNRRSLKASVKFLNPTRVLSQIGSENVAGFTS